MIIEITNVYYLVHCTALKSEYPRNKNYDYKTILKNGNELTSSHIRSLKTLTDSVLLIVELVKVLPLGYAHFSQTFAQKL